MASQLPERPRTKQQNQGYAAGVVVLVVVLSVFLPVSFGLLVGLYVTSMVWQGPLLVLDPTLPDAKRQRWIKAVTSESAFPFRFLGFGDPDGQGRDVWWPPTRLSAWWAVIVGLVSVGVEWALTVGLGSQWTQMRDAVGSGRSVGMMAVYGPLAFVSGFWFAQAWSAAHRHRRDETDRSPVAFFSVDALKSHAPKVLAAVVVGGGFVGYSMRIFDVVWVVAGGVGGGVVAGLAALTVAEVKAVVGPWRVIVDRRKEWQQMWMGILPSAAPPAWAHDSPQPAGVDESEATHTMAVFAASPGVPFTTYSSSKVVEGMKAQLGVSDLFLYQLNAMDETNRPIPGEPHPSGFVVAWSDLPPQPLPYLGFGLDAITRRFHLRRVVHQVFADLKLGVPWMVGAPTELTATGSDGMLFESQWVPPKAVTADTLIAANDRIAEKMGCGYVRVGQRINPATNSRSDYVSIVVGDAPDLWTLDDERGTRSFLDALDVEAAFVAAGLGRPERVQVMRIPSRGSGLDVRRIKVTTAAASAEAIAKTVTKLRAVLGHLVVEGVQSGHKLEARTMYLWWFPDGEDPDAHLNPELKARVRDAVSRAALLSACASVGLGHPAVTNLKVMKNGDSDAVRVTLLLPEGKSHADLLAASERLSEELRAGAVTVARIKLGDDLADSTNEQMVEKKYAIVWFTPRSSFNGVDVKAVDGPGPDGTTVTTIQRGRFAEEISEGDWDGRFGHPRVRLADEAGGTPRLLGLESLPGDVTRHTFSKVGAFTSEDVAKKRDALKELLKVQYLIINYATPGVFTCDVAAKDPIPSIAPLPRNGDNLDVSSSWNWIPFGLNAQGEEVGWDLKLAPHALICGQTGSGKSVQLQAMLYGALLRGYDVCVADPIKDGADFRWAENKCESFCVSLEATAAMLDRKYGQITSQKKLRSKHEVGAWYDLPDELRPNPTLIVMDEFFSLVALEKSRSDEAKERNELKEMILDLTGKFAREARAAGIHLALVAQRPDAKVMGGEMKFNLGARVQIGTGSATDINMTLRQPEVYDVNIVSPPGTKTKGRGVIDIEGGTSEIYQGYFEPETANLKGDIVHLPDYDHTPGSAGPVAGVPAGQVLEDW